jgi:MoaA/NifB/PqqE/SkfB family radical SAM enzyme
VGSSIGSEETVGFDKIVQHEEAAHEKRNWVRLTYDCNDRCIFCLDSHTHDGTVRDRESIKAQILDGRRKGAERLILSGGEPTIHPQYVDFIRLGHAAGYAKVQTVTNGRMFAYRDFLVRCIDAGLDEITFSIHGPNARIHDALVGVKGAYEEEITGLRHALDDGRPIVNVDVCVNRANVRHLPPMLEGLYAMGVREFDLLQVIPFGRAFVEGKDTLFYDLDDVRPELEQVLAFSDRPDVHVWFNRFPVEHLEGHEHLIQDPYKLTDEVRGRKDEYARWIRDGEPIDCREPERCRYCYVSRLCDRLEHELAALQTERFDVVRVDAGWERAQAPVYGGDPASARKRLNVIDGAHGYEGPSIVDRIAHSGADTVRIEAHDLAAARVVLDALPTLPRIELVLRDFAGVPADLPAALVRVTVDDPAAAERLLAVDAAFEVEVVLCRDTAPWLLALGHASPRLALVVPGHDRLTASSECDVDLVEFFAGFTHEVPVAGVPACILGRAPRPSRRVLDLTLLEPGGELEMFRFVRRFVADHYRVKSRRCRDCVHVERCDGLHVNYVRAHGFGAMTPVLFSTHA